MSRPNYIRTPAAPLAHVPMEPLRITDFTVATDAAAMEPAMRDWLQAFVADLPSKVTGGWKRYLATPRARLFERQPGQGGFAHGMAAMLVVPARSLQDFAACDASVFAGSDVTVIGVSLPGPATAKSAGLPALFGYDPTRLESSWRPPRDRHAQAMALPLLLPGWRAVPACGLHAGWQALDAEAGSDASTLGRWLTDLARMERAALIAQTLEIHPKSGSYPVAGSAGGGLGGPMTGAMRSLM